MDTLDIEELEIEIIENTRGSVTTSMVFASDKGRIRFSTEASLKLGLTEGDYIIVGKVGNLSFLAKKPRGLSKNGFVVHKPKKSTHLFINSKSLITQIRRGNYNFEDVIIKGDIYWLPLKKID